MPNLTYIDVGAAGRLDITHVDGVGIDPIELDIDLVFTHRPDGTWELGTDGVQTSTLWFGSQFFDLNAVLTANNIDFTRGVTRLSVDMNNAMIAQALTGTVAFIDKKDYGVHIRVNIPEPSSICLGLLAMFAGAIFRRGSRS
jgi:hypothetical protein